MNDYKSTAVATAMVMAGSLTMVGDLLGHSALKGIGLASHLSPAPKVFTAQEGFETFSSTFQLYWQSENGSGQQRLLSRTEYQRMLGPYNRRNAYGAALSYGPVLAANPKTQGMLASVSRYAFCSEKHLLSELIPTVTEPNRRVRISLIPGASQAAGHWQLDYEIDCTKQENIG